MAEISRFFWFEADAVISIGTRNGCRWLVQRCLKSENVEFDADHMLERCRLFLIIALGETVLATGIALSTSTFSANALIASMSAMVLTIALWSLTFGGTHRMVLRHLQETHDPIRASRHAINALFALVTGLIALAVASERAISHPNGHTTVGFSLLLAGGPILFLSAQGWYLHQVLGASARLQLLSCAALLIASPITVVMPTGAALTLMSVIVAVTAGLDRRVGVD